jgi:endonuclease/exonuclease/phosphatase family metal-dependent hydrolase
LRPFVWLSGGQIRWRTIHSILEQGYVDGYKQHHPDRAGLTFPTWDPHVRLDYAFVPAAFARRLRACDVVTLPSAVDTSDHFPLLFELDVAAQADVGGPPAVVAEARAPDELR